MAKPKKKAARDCLLGFKVTEAEYAIVIKKAKAAGREPSDFMRWELIYKDKKKGA